MLVHLYWSSRLSELIICSYMSRFTCPLRAERQLKSSQEPTLRRVEISRQQSSESRLKEIDIQQRSK